MKQIQIDALNNEIRLHKEKKTKKEKKKEKKTFFSNKELKVSSDLPS